jgi:hypothetical protein
MLSILGNALSMRGNVYKSNISADDFQKSRVTGHWDHKVSVSAKKVIKKFHSRVTLREKINILLCQHLFLADLTPLS